MKGKNIDSANSYNIIVRDYIDMSFNERMRLEPLDLGFANLTIVEKEPIKQQDNKLINSILKLIKAV